MFCTHCGKEINDNAVVCVHCGVSTGNMVNFPKTDKKSDKVKSYANAGFVISLVSIALGMFCLLPAIGLSLSMLSLNGSRETGEKNALAICGTVLNAVILLLWVVILLGGISEILF